jgi:hypothetical protein
VQVAIDDSNRGQENAPAFILAGFMATVPNWRTFTDAWQEELDRSPSIRLLKGSDAINLRHDFGGLTEQERDHRLLAFVKIIQKHAIASIHTSIVKRDFDRILSHFGGAFKKLYIESVLALVTRGMHFAERRRMRQPFEYIFDKEILTPNQLRNLHRKTLERLPQKARLVKTFRHDTDDNFYPIQAADLFARYLREKMLAESEGRIFESIVLDTLMKIPRIDATVTDKFLKHIAKGLSDFYAGE